MKRFKDPLLNYFDETDRVASRNVDLYHDINNDKAHGMFKTEQSLLFYQSIDDMFPAFAATKRVVFTYQHLFSIEYLLQYLGDDMKLTHKFNTYKDPRGYVVRYDTIKAPLTQGILTLEYHSAEKTNKLCRLMVVGMMEKLDEYFKRLG